MFVCGFLLPQHKTTIQMCLTNSLVALFYTIGATYSQTLSTNFVMPLLLLI